MLGDKIASTIVAQSADVPTIKWNGTGVTLGDLVRPGEVWGQLNTYRRRCSYGTIERVDDAQFWMNRKGRRGPVLDEQKGYTRPSFG